MDRRVSKLLSGFHALTGGSRPPIWLVTQRRGGPCLKNTIISFKVSVNGSALCAKTAHNAEQFVGRIYGSVAAYSIDKVDQICSSKACQWTSSLQLKMFFCITSAVLATKQWFGGMLALSIQSCYHQRHWIGKLKWRRWFQSWRLCLLSPKHVKNLSTALAPLASDRHDVAAGNQMFALHQRTNAGKPVKLARTCHPRSCRAETIFIIKTFSKAVLSATLQHTHEPCHWALNRVFLQHLAYETSIRFLGVTGSESGQFLSNSVILVKRSTVYWRIVAPRLDYSHYS